MTGEKGRERLRKVTHRGRSILLTDYSGFIKWKDWQALIEAEMQLMPREPLGSVRALAIFTGSRFSDEVFEAITRLALANRPYIKASALVGLARCSGRSFSRESNGRRAGTSAYSTRWRRRWTGWPSRSDLQRRLQCDPE